MDKPVRVPEGFDDQQRERIRARLITYLKQHKIGVPKLLGRIEDADPRKRTMPLSNLQRFLRGTHRTMDIYVAMCAQFLDGLDEPLDPADFGRAFHAFLGWPGGEDKGLAALHGTYELTWSNDPVDTLAASSSPETNRNKVVLLARAASAYLIVQEDQPEAAPSALQTGRRTAYDGVAVSVGATVHVLLRNCLTHRPRHYALTGQDEWLIGEGFERPAGTGRETRFSLRLAKLSDEPRPEVLTGTIH